jgi:hypothetical protein
VLQSVVSDGASDGGAGGAGDSRPHTPVVTTTADDGDGAFDDDSIVAIVMPNGAHHVDLRAADPADTPDVVSAREQELAIFDRWIKQLQTERLARPGPTP